ncbi:MAG TPA: hypothetical protein VII99_10775 [Bacteroidia bacterium]
MNYLFLVLVLIFQIGACQSPAKRTDIGSVSYFIVGRIKTVEIHEGIPFKVKVENIDSKILNQYISIQILNFEKFQMTYWIDGKQKTGSYEFEKPFETKEMKLTVSRTMQQSTYNENLALIIYQFIVK